MYLEINFEREALILSYEKARTIKPRVVPSRNLSAFACYDVMCPSERVWFSVIFTRSIDGKPVGNCKCAAGENGDYCYHLAAALYLHCGLVQHGLCRPITDSIWSPISEETILENKGAASAASFLLKPFPVNYLSKV